MKTAPSHQQPAVSKTHSFLTQGRWSRPALVLGFDPAEVVRRAVVNGTLLKVGPTCGRPRPSNQTTESAPSAALPQAAKKTPAQLMRDLRARRKAAGLTSDGKPKRKFLKVHPELSGLPRREYLTRFMRMRRGKPTTGPIRPYRRASAPTP